MSLNDLIKDDASAVFMAAGGWRESATYKPKLYSVGDSRPDRTINIVIDRQEATIISEDQQVPAPVWQIEVVNDATLGISSEELDLGGDVLSFPSRVGESATDHTITRLLAHDHGMLSLECR